MLVFKRKSSSHSLLRISGFDWLKLLTRLAFVFLIVALLTMLGFIIDQFLFSNRVDWTFCFAKTEIRKTISLGSEILLFLLFEQFLLQSF